MFRFVIIACALFAVTLAGDMPEFLKTCAEENKLDLSKFNASVKEEDLNTHDFYCFEKCLGEKQQTMDEKGDFNVENVVKNIKTIKDFEVTEEKIKEAVKKCTEENNDSDACEKSSKRGRCFIKEVAPEDLLNKWKKHWEHV